MHRSKFHAHPLKESPCLQYPIAHLVNNLLRTVWAVEGVTVAGREISFTIPGELRAKGRPRFSARNGIVRTYTDRKTASDEAIVRTTAAQAFRGQDMLMGPLGISVTIRKIPPPSWSKQKTKDVRWITGRPDLDNSLKLILDGLNGILFMDDSQIAVVTSQRIYAKEFAVDITVAELT